jgi:pimeloyl-ACP methyl ester carboxylesterase
MPQDHVLLATLSSSAERHSTPCGVGALVWRRWSGGRATPGRPVILCHGGSGSWTHWIATIPALVAAGFEVWAVDLPGLGESAMPPEPHNPETCGRLVAEGVRRLIPAERWPSLVGFSFGAHVGMFAAIDLGPYISDFTIVGSSALGLQHPPDMDQLPKERARMTDAERREVHRRTLEILMIHNPLRIDELAIDLQAANVARARFRSREFAKSDAIKQGLAQVRVPVHAIWGARDILAYPALEDVRAALATHQAALDWRIVPDAGHWVMYEQPQSFARELIDALKG